MQYKFAISQKFMSHRFVGSVTTCVAKAPEKTGPIGIECFRPGKEEQARVEASNTLGTCIKIVNLGRLRSASMSLT